MKYNIIYFIRKLPGRDLVQNFPARWRSSMAYSISKKEKEEKEKNKYILFISNNSQTKFDEDEKERIIL